MRSRLIRKFENLAPLSAEDKILLERITANVREVDAKVDLIREGEAPTDVHLILDGFACRHKITADGRRQIMAFLVPGDFCDIHVFILKEMDHSVATLSTCHVVDISRSQILAMLERPSLARALWWSTLVDEATLREWLLNIGQREAPQRIAHLLCELLLRLRAVGLADLDGYELPITQAELAETIGVSTVHVNRSLHTLREAGLITLTSKQLVILDAKGLVEFSGFERNYLHLDSVAAVERLRS
jgi:CRP-like cAMP-binding protein